MHVVRGTVLLSGILGLTLESVAHGAAQVALGKVNTSVGILPTNTTNKWKLQTDPIVTDISNNGPDFSQYQPQDGSLSNTFDNTKFTLHSSTDPNTDPVHNPLNFQLDGSDPSMNGLGGFSVMSADIQMTGGGDVDIFRDTTNFFQTDATDDTTNGSISGVPTGMITNITFEITPINNSGIQANDVLPANQDQNFFELDLDALTAGLVPNFTPGLVTVFGGPGDFLNVMPIDPGSGLQPIMTQYNAQNNPFVPSSATPEPGSLTLLGLAGMALLPRRRRRN